ncbi:DUF4878 domain-containing protein [Mycolicibacterium sp.]|jgi:hypothetical protein|uniref:Rv0361 family membrane protein n=1 Tax=Mycolicibacterium sp. TaxID=2320850 RepID=UPI001A289976|nr:DUF4878 domain-containing protein [Mycolicibacterium sp.]MBJ7400311.1 DUF4878 domain-containing protein [Mycolicibacterium sp.]
MSNPSGTDHDHDTDPVTEVIEIGGLVGQTDTATGERRYTAPGFDAGSTQIIDRVPDAETEFITGPRAIGPQAIPPSSLSPRQSKWLIPVILFIAALAAALILGLILIKKADSANASRENMVRSTIQTFDTAVRNGDLATLRRVTCGQTRDNYVNYDDLAWADTYSQVLAANQYPVVASIDEVVINGDHAEANVTSYMAANPASTSVHSFDLQFRDDQWKICQSS